MDKSRLFQPLRVGRFELNHRLVLAPLTRFRATDSHAPTDMMVEYYSQRASTQGTLLISEGTFISLEDGGMRNVPGIYNNEQIAAWRKVTDAVHAQGSYIFCQLWSLGRAADSTVIAEEGYSIYSSSATPMTEKAPMPNELRVDQIQERIGNYVQAAKNAIEAGFDGVELHGANGYLIDQFTQDVCNQRHDTYGGSIENRSRFAIEIATQISSAIGPERTGIRLSPWSHFQAMRMENPIPQFSDVMQKLANLDLAYLHLVESRISGNADTEGSDSLDFAYDIWKGPILIAGGYRPDSARRLVEERPTKDIAVVFGRYWISTPDLPFRILHGIELTKWDRKTFYQPKSAAGYSDYPMSEQYQQMEGEGISAHKL